MSRLRAIIEAGMPQAARPALRYQLDADAWRSMVAALAEEPAVALLGLWAEASAVHAAFWLPEMPSAEAGAGEVAAEAQQPLPATPLLLASVLVENGQFPALSPARLGATWYERMLHDLWGIAAEGGLDQRPWMDQGQWNLQAPLSAAPGPPQAPPAEPQLLPVAGEGEGADLHQIVLGPVQAGVAEAAQLRLHVLGERVVRAEARLGWLHKGVLSLMRGKSPRAAARYIARLSGDATVAHALAFAQAAEAATGVTPPPRAQRLRAVMLELERLHNHLNDWGAVCREAGFGWLDAQCGTLREAVLRVCHSAFRHRLMMDLVVPGGIAADITTGADAVILAALDLVAEAIPRLLGTYDSHTSLQERVVGRGVVTPELVMQLAVGGVAGRAVGRDFDARLALPQPPYDTTLPEAPLFSAGDIDARTRLRVEEMLDSISMIGLWLRDLPAGETVHPLPLQRGEGCALVESSRGDILHWLRLDDGGMIIANFARDPSWMLWPALEGAAAGGMLADVPLLARSLNPSASGVDL